MQKVTKQKMILRFQKPANALEGWTSSLPIGNGDIGALIQGGVRYEKIMITSAESIWKGYVGVLPDVSDKIKEVQKHVMAKNQTLAGITFEKAFATKKYFPSKACPFPIADLIVEQSLGNRHVLNYGRYINMENGEVSVCFSDSGTKIDRSIFVSMSNDLIFYEITKTGNRQLDVELSLQLHDLSTTSFDGVYCGGFRNKYQLLENNFIYFGVEDVGVSSGVVAKVLTDQKAIYQVVGDKLKVENAEKILVVMAVYNNKPKDKGFEACRNLINGLKHVNYEKFLKDHTTLYQKMIGKTELSLSNEKEIYVENMVAKLDDTSTLLYEKMFYYSKYLYTIGFSTKFAPLFKTGLWSYHYANVNALADSSCYLPALYSLCNQVGMEQKQEVLFEYYTKFQDDLKKNAARIYKSTGYMIPPYIVHGSCLPASTRAKDLSTTIGGAIIANLMYEHFKYTQDIKFLKNTALPFMREILNFYVNFFHKEGNGNFESCPSFSPLGKSKYFEDKNIGVYNSCTCDFAVVRCLVQNVISASSNYSIPVSEIVEYQQFLNSLPPIKIDGGVVSEFSNDDNSNKSCGFTQLYPVYGSKEITSKSSPNRISAFLNTVVQKIGNGVFAQSSLSLGRLAEISALLGQGDACLNILRYMITNFGAGNLLFFNYDKNNLCAFVEGDNYFNIAGNQLFATSIVASLVSENINSISFLCAKPTSWKIGKIEGVRTKKNLVVDVEWDDKKGTALIKFKAIKSTTFNVCLFSGVKRVKNYVIDPINPFIENINLASGKSLILEVKY